MSFNLSESSKSVCLFNNNFVHKILLQKWDMQIWEANNTKITATAVIFELSVNLWRMEPGKFQVIEQGHYTSILNGHNYTLIQKKYLPVFENIPGEVTIGPVTIVDTVKKTTNTDYIELFINGIIPPETINNEDAAGVKAWVFQGHLFVSTALRGILEDIRGCDLQFHPGFGLWGG